MSCFFDVVMYYERSAERGHWIFKRCDL